MPHPSVGAVDNLGALRTEELRLPCQRLGIDPPVLLKFHDSARGERQRHGDARALTNVDMLEVEAAIRQVIEDVRPHVLLTFDPHGGYYHLRIAVTFTDPVAFVKPLSIVVNMELAADTEMLEAVCEVNSDRWVGSFSTSQKAVVRVAPELLATYVGVYSGPYAGRLRTVAITLVDGELLAPFMGRDKRDA